MDVLSMAVALADQLWRYDEPTRNGVIIHWVARRHPDCSSVVEWDAWASFTGVWAHTVPVESGWRR